VSLHGLLKVSRVLGGKKDLGANITKLFDGATDRKSPAASLKACSSGPFDRCVSSSRSVAWDGGESVVSETLGEPHHPMAG
jgi:hypothetical protein